VEWLKVVPAGESRPLYSDLWNGATSELIEAGVQSPGTASDRRPGSCSTTDASSRWEAGLYSCHRTRDLT
jgi:hypothetical protein